VKVVVSGRIDALGEMEYADGGTVRGVLLKLHTDDVRAVGQANLLFKDVRVTIEVREPDSPVTP
jgi:hypothetical protein